jgi:hypothetical protein
MRLGGAALPVLKDGADGADHFGWMVDFRAVICFGVELPAEEG